MPKVLRLKKRIIRKRVLSKYLLLWYRLRYKILKISKFYSNFSRSRFYKKKRFLKSHFISFAGIKCSPRAYTTLYFFRNYRVWLQENFLFLYSVQYTIIRQLYLRFFNVSYKQVMFKINNFSRVIHFLYFLLFRRLLKSKEKSKYIFKNYSKASANAHLWCLHNTNYYLNIVNGRKLFFKGFSIKKPLKKSFPLPGLKFRKKSSFKFFLKRLYYGFIKRGIDFLSLYSREFFYSLDKTLIASGNRLKFNNILSILLANVRSFLKMFLLRLFLWLGTVFFNSYSRFYRKGFKRKRIKIILRWWMPMCSYALASKKDFLKYKFYSFSMFFSFIGVLYSEQSLVRKYPYRYALSYFISLLNYKAYMLFPHFLKKIKKQFNYRTFFNSVYGFSFGSVRSFNSNLSFLIREHSEYIFSTFINIFGVTLISNSIVVDLAHFLTPYKYSTRFFYPSIITILKECLKVTTLTVKELLVLPQRSHSYIKRKDVGNLQSFVDFNNINFIPFRSNFRLNYYQFAFLFISTLIDFRYVFVARCIGGFFQKALGQFFLCFDYGFKKILDIPLLSVMNFDRYKGQNSVSLIDSQFYVFFVELLKLKFNKIYNRPRRFRNLKFLDWNDFIIMEERNPLKKGPTMKEKFSLKLLNSLYEVVEYRYSFKKQIDLYMKSFSPFFFSSINSLNFVRFFNARSLYKGIVLSSVTILFYFKRFVTIRSTLVNSRKIGFFFFNVNFNSKLFISVRILNRLSFVSSFLFKVKKLVIESSISFFDWFILFFLFYFFSFQYLKSYLLIHLINNNTKI